MFVALRERLDNKHRWGRGETWQYAYLESPTGRQVGSTRGAFCESVTRWLLSASSTATRAVRRPSRNANLRAISLLSMTLKIHPRPFPCLRYGTSVSAPRSQFRSFARAQHESTSSHYAPRTSLSSLPSAQCSNCSSSRNMCFSSAPCASSLPLPLPHSHSPRPPHSVTLTVPPSSWVAAARPLTCRSA